MVASGYMAYIATVLALVVTPILTLLEDQAIRRQLSK